MIPQINLPIKCTNNPWYPDNTARKTMMSKVSNRDFIIVTYYTRFPVNASQYKPHYLANSSTSEADASDTYV